MSMEAAVTILDIMTAEDMPRELYIEDMIDNILLGVKHMLVNTILVAYNTQRHSLEGRQRQGQRLEEGFLHGW
jgi:hypothetical protein